MFEKRKKRNNNKKRKYDYRRKNNINRNRLKTISNGEIVLIDASLEAISGQNDSK